MNALPSIYFTWTTGEESNGPESEVAGNTILKASKTLLSEEGVKILASWTWTNGTIPLVNWAPVEQRDSRVRPNNVLFNSTPREDPEIKRRIRDPRRGDLIRVS